MLCKFGISALTEKSASPLLLNAASEESREVHAAKLPKIQKKTFFSCAACQIFKFGGCEEKSKMF